jgi:Pretoxin HINT domain
VWCAASTVDDFGIPYYLPKVGMTPLETVYGVDGYGNCIDFTGVNYVKANLGMEQLTKTNCTPKQLAELAEKNKLEAEISAGKDTDGSKATRLAQIYFNEAEQVARTRFGGYGGADNLQYIRMIRDFLFNPLTETSPQDLLAIAVALRIYIQIGDPREVAERLRVTAGILKKENAALQAFAKSCANSATLIGCLGRPSAKQGTVAALYASGLADTWDTMPFTTPWEAFWNNGFWDVFGAVSFGQLFKGLFTGLARRGVAGAAGALDDLARGAGRNGGRQTALGRAWAKNCKNSFSGDTKVWVVPTATNQTVKSGVRKAQGQFSKLATRAVKAGKNATKTAAIAVAISSLTVGRKVLAYNEATDSQGVYTVTQVRNHEKPIYELKVQGLESKAKPETINVTAEHPFFVSKFVDAKPRPKAEGHEDLSSHWVGTKDLKSGDVLKRSSGLGRVLEVKLTERSARVYNFTVNEAHTYFVGEGQWLVHNGPGKAACGFDWDHIFDRHSDFGRTAQQRTTGSVFEGLSEEQIRARVRAAWGERQLLETQTDFATGVVRQKYQGIDPVSGQVVEMWFNKTTGVVETAYPALFPKVK